jgi:spore coat protein H
MPLLFFSLWVALFATSVTPLPLPALDQTWPGDLFSGNGISLVEIELSSTSLDRLRQNPRGDVSGIVRINGQTFPQAAVHLKGSGTFQSLDEKPSFTVDLLKTDEKNDARGLDKIHLNNSVEDPTFVQEKLAGEIFRAAGVAAPRVTHALVRLNGRSRGLYVLKEGFDANFLANHFSRPDGHLYDKKSFRLEKRNGKTVSPELASVAAAVQEADPRARWEKLNQLLEIDGFISFVAAEVLICHWDGYALGNNNFRVYREPTSGKFIFLPAGMDQTFGNPAFPTHPEMSGAIACALMETCEGRKRLETRFKQLAFSFDAPRLVDRAQALITGLRPSISWAEFKEIRCNLDELAQNILARASFVKRDSFSFASITH